MIDIPPPVTGHAIAEPAELPVPPPRRGPGAVGLWARVGLAVALLAASAGARAWQAGRVDHMLREGRKSPFALADIPTTLGSWTGRDDAMDPIIARATGSTDRIVRVYQNAVTGQRVSVIVLFGPSSEMFIHSPENCYPRAGYTRIGAPLRRDLAVGEWRWPFREVVYMKGEGGQADQQDVYFSWRYSGRWTPGLANPKEFERIPGMFKVQVSRPVQDAEIDLLDVGNPCEAFLAQLMPEIERRLAQSRGKS